MNIFDNYKGDGVFLRTDTVEYPDLRRLWESSLALFWTTKMVDFSKDSLGFKTMTETQQRMFILNNGYQTLMDSEVVGVYSRLAQHTYSADLALSYTQIGFTETIHATSYSDGLVQMFGSDATRVINEVEADPVVSRRLDSEIDYLSAVIEDPSPINIFKLVVATYILERVKFPFSFFVTLSINKGSGNAINGFAQLISRISEEELEIHVPTNSIAIKLAIKQYGFDVELVKEIADKVLEQELLWNEYLQKDGPIPGYNKAIGENFIRYSHNKALRDIGYKDIETIKPDSFVDWFNHARNPNNKQVSQQEMKSTQYSKGTIQDDLSRFDENANA